MKNDNPRLRLESFDLRQRADLSMIWEHKPCTYRCEQAQFWNARIKINRFQYNCVSSIACLVIMLDMDFQYAGEGGQWKL